MAEYIEREALEKQIYEAQNELIRNDDRNWNMNRKYFKGLAWARRLLLDAPAADVVEVVRCKNCTEWNETEGECSHWYGFRENDFCSYGERKVDDDRK
jgi:hypothetical protein